MFVHSSFEPIYINQTVLSNFLHSVQHHKSPIGVLYTPDCEWTRAQIDCMLSAVGARDFL